MTEFKVVTLDGPGGVGKSTTGQALAHRLGFYFLSTGRIYRALAWLALERGWLPGQDLPDGTLEDAVLEIEPDGALRVNGMEPGEALSREDISHAASVLSTQPPVRELSNRVQRDTVTRIGRAGRFAGVILEGRDSGTVVFPEANHKIFLTAQPEVRAKRRHDELKKTDPGLTLESVTEALGIRDRRDSGREIAPLRAAPDAVTVDTSDMTQQAVVQAIAGIVTGGGRDPAAR